MPSAFPIDQISQAMVALGSTLPTFDGEAIDIAELGGNDFSDEGDLKLISPSVRIRLATAAYKAKESQKLTYQGGIQFAALCFSENLRSRSDERLDTMRLLAQVLDCFTGARLKLTDGGWTEPLELLSVSPVMNDGIVIDQYYMAVWNIGVLAQFPGPNAHFGEK